MQSSVNSGYLPGVKCLVVVITPVLQGHSRGDHPQAALCSFCLQGAGSCLGAFLLGQLQVVGVHANIPVSIASHVWEHRNRDKKIEESKMSPLSHSLTSSLFDKLYMKLSLFCSLTHRPDFGAESLCDHTDGLFFHLTSGRSSPGRALQTCS